MLLDEYCRSFGGAFAFVFDVLDGELDLKPNGRRIKSRPSMVAKLMRETARLTQIQDIAGCRVIVGDAIDQRETVERIVSRFGESKVHDRRLSPSHGYRAVHIIVVRDGWPIEVQVRTHLQHAWAELSERVADAVGLGIKYGLGPDHIRTRLLDLSRYVQLIEEAELEPTWPSDAGRRALFAPLKGALQDLFNETARQMTLQQP